MIETITLGGRTGQVIYLNDQWEPVSLKEATLAKVVFKDGSSAFYKIEDKPEPKTAASGIALHRTADSFVKRLQVTFNYAFARGRIALGKKGDNVDAAIRAIEQALKDTLPKTLRKIAQAGGVVGAKTVPMLKTAEELRTDAQKPLRFQFDLKNPKVTEWAEEHAAKLIKDITEVSRERIRRAVIDRVEGDEFEDSFENILAAVGDKTRAELIARHETIQAVSEGQRLAWDQAVEDGYLTGKEKRVWIVTPDERLCEICEALDGETAGLGEQYANEYDGPPAHVNCRCTEGLV